MRKCILLLFLAVLLFCSCTMEVSSGWRYEPYPYYYGPYYGPYYYAHPYYDHGWYHRHRPYPHYR